MDVSKFNDAYFAKIKAKKAKTADGAPPALLSSYPSYPFLPILSSFLATSQTVCLARSTFLFRPNFEDQSVYVVPNKNRHALVELAADGPPSLIRTAPRRRRAQASSRRRTRRSR